jgi:hypothetical protein
MPPSPARATGPLPAAGEIRPDPEGARGLVACFDPARALLPVRLVPVARVVDLLAVSHAPDRIAAYRAAMQAGERFPPIAVLPFAGRYWIADGHKRWSAYRALGAREVWVELWTARRWLRDQGRQVAGTGRRIGRALALLAVRPREGLALLAAAPRHWWRVVRSLVGHAVAAARSRS